MLGREGRDIVVKRPLNGGVIADFERTKKMLAHFVKKAKSGGSQMSLQAVMSMTSDVTHVEQRALAKCGGRSAYRQSFYDGRRSGGGFRRGRFAAR